MSAYTRLRAAGQSLPAYQHALIEKIQQISLDDSIQLKLDPESVRISYLRWMGDLDRLKTYGIEVYSPLIYLESLQCLCFALSSSGVIANVQSSFETFRVGPAGLSQRLFSGFPEEMLALSFVIPLWLDTKSALENVSVASLAREISRDELAAACTTIFLQPSVALRFSSFFAVGRPSLH